MNEEEFYKKYDDKWYQKTWGIILLLIICFPIGAYLMWVYTKWKKSIKLLITIGVILVITGIWNTGRPKETKKTESNTTASYTTYQYNDVDTTETKKETAQETKKETTTEDKKEETKKEPEVVAYTEGMYKVGTDVPEGEYKIFSKGRCYVECAKDSTGATESITFNANLYYETMYVTLKTGDYFTMTSGIMYKASEAPKVTDEEISDGMYKVGVDIPAGEYKVIPTSTERKAYYEVSTNSRHQTEDIVTNGNINIDTYLTVQDGQYITLKRCKMQK